MKNKMLQTNSTLNFFNQAPLIFKEVKSNNIIYKITASNLNLYLFANTNNHWDSLNLQYTGFYLKKKLKKKLFLKIFINCFLFQWARLAFRGKSFRVRNFCNKNKFTLNFGYSHWTKLKLLNNWAFFKKKRQNYIIYTYTLKDFLYFKRFFPYIKFYNCYTMRGLRLKKQFIIRRFGKISQHISSLH